MDELKEMIELFKSRYVYIGDYGSTVSVKADNELIYRILSEISNRIDAIEQRQEIGF